MVAAELPPSLVRPRVTGSNLSEPTLLVNVVRDEIRKDPRTRILLRGGPGSGKTTALGVLSAEFSGTHQLALIDGPGPEGMEPIALPDGTTLVEAVGNGDDPVYSLVGEGRLTGYRSRILHMAPWSRDDVIELLLQCARESCGSVMQRLSDDDSWNLLEGSPTLWSIVIAKMVADPTLQGADSILGQYANERLPDGYRFDNMQLEYISECSAGKESLRVHGTRRRFDLDHDLEKLTRHKPIADYFLARHVARELQSDAKVLGWITGNRSPGLRTRLARIIDQKAIKNLERALKTKKYEFHHATVVRLLLDVDPDWRPQRPLRNLVCADLRKARWPGVDLRKSELEQAELIGADLRGARLSEVRSTRLDEANLSHGRMFRFRAHRSVFDRARLDYANMGRAMFHQCSHEDTSFVISNLQCAGFDGCRLIGADFTRANLSNSTFMACTIQHTCFRGANLQGILLRRMDLRTAVFQDANLEGANLLSANMEYIDLDRGRLSGANLTNAQLTGSKLPDVDFSHANLSGAKLAEVDWENANLQSANLCGAIFHMGSSRSGMVSSTIASEGTRTGFYTDDSNEQHFKSPEEIRKANLRGADLRGANLDLVDFYLVDLRDSRYDMKYHDHLVRCGAILS